MTTLKSFQAEIDSIAHDKHAQQRIEAQQAYAAAEAAKYHGKGVKKEDKAKAVAAAAVAKPVIEEDAADEVEVPLQTLLLQPLSTDVEDPADDPVQARLAAALLKNHGELLIPLGAHPSPLHVYNQPSVSVPPPIAGLKSSSAAETPSENMDEAPKVGEALTSAEIEICLARLKVAIEPIGGQISELYRDGLYGCWMIRLTPRGVEEITEVRVAVVGNVDAGKSTTLGVLTRGGLDDGRGKARVALFRHPHEIETGRTSSVGTEILGFSPVGQPVVPSIHAVDPNDPHSFSHLASAKREKQNWDEICKKAAKVVSFIDLAGHERYLKTTLYGLSGCAPDYVLLMVGGNAGLIGMSKEHLGVALALNVPIAVCITKIDMTPPHVLEQTVSMLVKVLKSPGCRRIPVFVKTPQNAVDCARFVSAPIPGSSSLRLCPIFMVSNVSGQNLDMLRTFLNVLPSSQGGDKYVVDAPFEFQVSDVFSVPFVGTVVSGVIQSGSVHANDAVLLGPDSVGQFLPTAVKTIQRKRASVNSAEAGQSVSFALKRIRRTQVRKGMVLVAKTDNPPKAVKRFEGMVMVLHHSSTIQPRYQGILHSGSVRQTVRIVALDHPKGLIRTGDRALVTFEFMGQPEFLKEGSMLLLREGRTKVLGVITKLG